MTLLHILLFSIVAALLGALAGNRWRGWLMLGVSVVAIYWLGSVSPIRTLDFWLPTATLALTALVWAATRPAPVDPRTDPPAPAGETWITAAVVAVLVLAIALLRYIPALCCITPSPPPGLISVALVLVAAVGAVALVGRFLSGTRAVILALLGLLVGLLIVLKYEPLSVAASAALRTLTAQSAANASALDVRWLGFSYVAFRLLHLLLDRLAGRLPALSLREAITYTIFFPSYTAGPIDRMERFVKDLRAPFVLTLPIAVEAGQRLVIGLFRKFVLADALALIALNAQNAVQTSSALWTWVLLYAYAFRLYLDFAGYTDVAIGLGLLMGIRLPENFQRPYLKPNLTAFWNAWHITLAQWVRTYVFNPLTRALRASPMRIPAAPIILIGQLVTMMLIGLWHGITWNFVIWGAWHGIGLFIHNRWANAMRVPLRRLEERPLLKRLYTGAAVVLTFHYVLLGWVWFALPTVDLSGTVFIRLFGG